MKICAIICEFNPFHNGHGYLLKRARELSGCERLLCVMSGNFTQRGDIAVADKFTRARHAIEGGADCVVELPASFAVAPAEIFASGAIKLISSIPQVSALCFGCETADKTNLFKAAEVLCEESQSFKEALKSGLYNGNSYIKSYFSAFEACGGDSKFISKPNNILAIEYIKAVKRCGKDINVIPIGRVGSDYNDEGIKENYSSASAIRKNFGSPLIKDNVPPFVYRDLKNFSAETEKFEFALALELSRTESNALKGVYGCGEGLENALTNGDFAETYNQILARLTSKRYSSSRIKRILCANFLRLYARDCAEYLKNDLYFTPLAVKNEACNDIMSALGSSGLPVITAGSNLLKLNETALKCKKSDDFAHAQWCKITGKNIKNRLQIV